MWIGKKNMTLCDAKASYFFYDAPLFDLFHSLIIYGYLTLSSHNN